MRLFSALKRSFTDFRRHPWLHSLSIFTITISLLILGVFLIGYRNFVLVAKQASPEIMGTAYLQEGLNELEIVNLKDRVLALEGVAKVEFKTRQSVVEEISGLYGEGEVPAEDIQTLFPNILEVHLVESVSSDEIELLRNQVASYPEVHEVDFSQGWLAQFKQVREILRWIGIGLMIGLLLGCSFIIANFMGMRHQSRRRDIEIIQLMGAGKNYVLLPFLWEGLLEGLLGVLLAIVALVALNILVLTPLAAQWSGIAGIENIAFLSPSQFGFMVGIGLLMAIIGSITVFFRFQDN